MTNYRTLIWIIKGETYLIHNFKILPDRYISVNGNEPCPIEDLGDYMLTSEYITNPETGFKKWFNAQNNP